jgi:16S rRNA processing protein RimM
MITDGFITIGYIVGPHGNKGELRIRILTEFPERFQRGVAVVIDNTVTHIEYSHLENEFGIIKIKGIHNYTDAELLRGKHIEIPESKRKPLIDGRYYQHEILGLGVWASHGAFLGKVTQILNTGSNDVYVISEGKKEILIPAIKGIILEIDIISKRIVIEQIEGLIE